ncbi:hypothetical protein ACIQFZ_31100 [Streptomyces sp. NPDC093064]|uniref:hypothetical protein n=1 Tax=Streptomyces sp. NPDC093064 TaxID=3366020 RepID=UPI0037FBA309
MRKRLTEAQAQAVTDGAALVQAPKWRESNAWHVTAADGSVLVVISPSYGSAGRNGQQQHLIGPGPSGFREK